jgi:putative transcriptional regulator
MLHPNNENSAIGSCSLSVDRPAPILNVRKIRLAAPRDIGRSQRRFADAIGVPVMTLRNWEQGRRRPTGPALVLLSMIQRDPMIVLKALGGTDV